MNIFKVRKDLIGSIDGQKSVKEILTEAKIIKEELGNKSYLLDVYISLFFATQNITNASHASQDGNRATSELRNLCSGILSNGEEGKEHPLYEKICDTLEENTYIKNYQEKYTQLNLLMILAFDSFSYHAICEYQEKIVYEMNSVIDMIRHNYLFKEISHIVGEYRLERLNLLLRQKFMISTFIDSFVQGLTDDILICLGETDEETNKYIFAIVADNL